MKSRKSHYDTLEIMQDRPYKKLVVWQEAHKLCLSVYTITKLFPKEELFALVSQMRRASYSVPMNIVEGNTRQSIKEHRHFIAIAQGSLEELHYQCTLAKELGYITDNQFSELDSSIGRTGYLLQKLRQSLL